MFWKIYAWAYAVIGVISTFYALSHDSNIAASLIDIGLSVIATFVIFFFAYGKRKGSPRAWLPFSIIFIVFDLLHNLYLEPIAEQMPLFTDLPGIVIGLVFSIPAYIAVFLYGRGKLNSHANPNATLIPPPEGKRGRSPVAGAWQALLALWRTNRIPALIIFVAAVLIPQAIFTFVLPDLTKMNFVTAAATIITLMAVNLVIIMTILVLAINTARGRSLTILQTLQLALRKIPAYIGLMILSSLLVLGGFILFVVPAVIITFRIYLAPYIMIDQNIGPIQALKLSNKLLRGNAVETFGIYGLFYTLCFVMIAVEIFVPVVGAILGGLLMFCGLAAMQIYLTWLYLDFSELSRQNMRRPKTSVVNIWLPILALVTMVGLLSSISYWISSSVKANKIYVTECYQVKLPAIYSVERKGACHLLAVSGSSTLEYRPIKSGAISARQLVSQGLTAIFPSNRYELFNSSASTYTPDGNSYIAVNLRDKQANGAFVTVVFINSQAPRYIDGADINNFVLIQPAIAGARPQTDFINQLVRNSIIITKTVTLNTVGSSAFKSNIENAIEAWNNGRYEDVMTYATNAKLDAATDYERSVVFGWQGEAEAALNKVASAEADLREGLKLNPADVLSWNALGNLLYQNRDDKAALECAAKMLSIDDSYASAYNLRGLISQARGNKAAAATDFNKALKLDPSNESIRKNLDSLR